MNMSEFHPLFGRNMQLQNEFHLQPKSCFASDWTRDVTMAKEVGHYLDQDEFGVQP